MSSQRYCLITGCGAGGIGHALARHFHSSGFTVFTTLLPHESRVHLEKPGFYAFSSDVTSDEDTKRLRKEIEGITGGRLDVLVNCAGIAYTMTAADTEVREVEKMFAVNVFGPMRMVHHFHPLIVAAKGAIVNIGSVGGIVPYVYGGTSDQPFKKLARLTCKSKLQRHESCAASLWKHTQSRDEAIWVRKLYQKPQEAANRKSRVRVINVISGEVGTNILKRDAERKLPEGKYPRTWAHSRLKGAD